MKIWILALVLSGPALPVFGSNLPSVFPQPWSSRDVAWQDLSIHLEQRYDLDRGVDAKIEVKKAQHVLKVISFEGIQALNGNAGLAIPEKQLIKDHFAILKRGDHDSRVLLVDSSGLKFASLPAKEIYISPNGRYLFCFQQSSEPSLPEYLVYDLAQNLVVMEAKDASRVGPYFASGIHYQLYAKGGRYLAVAQTDLAVDSEKAKKLSQTSMTEINLQMQSLRVFPKDEKTIQQSVPMLRISFVPHD